jgi:adenylate cyclase class 2
MLAKLRRNNRKNLFRQSTAPSEITGLVVGGNVRPPLDLLACRPAAGVSIEPGEMGREIELKFRLPQPAALRARLRKLGALAAARVEETNRIYDDAQGRLLSADCGLRIRSCRAPGADPQPAATLTFKGPRERGPTKAREEIECPIADPDAAADILARLGFGEVIVYQKRRETWRLATCEVCLDELPELGWFVEIEGPDPQSVTRAAAQLQLHERDALHETYVELAARHGTPDETGRRQLLFKS